MNVLVLIHSPFRMWNIPREHVELLRRTFPAHAFLHAEDDEAGLRMIADAEAAFSSQVNPDHLAAAPRLRWIHSPAAGVGGMLYPAMLQRDIVITNSKGMSAETIAEHVIAVVLAMWRRIPLAVRRQTAREWAQDEIGAPPGNRPLAGCRALVIGLGAIGAAASWRLHALGVHVTGIRRHVAAGAPKGVETVASPSRLHALLPDADIVVLAAPQTAHTRSLIGVEELARMNRAALLVNVSRGQLVDEAALVRALESGALGGAALDVFVDEPLSPDSPLWTLPNVLVTPHTSGFRPDHWDAATELFAENLRRFERGQTLLNSVDKAAGY